MALPLARVDPSVGLALEDVMKYLVDAVLVSAGLALAASDAAAAPATQVVNGMAHSCALTATGAVLCWGNNYYGQLGDGTTTDRSTPTPVAGLATGVAAVVAGEFHTCAVTTLGGVLCWGANGPGQLGDGTTTNRSTPTPVSGLGSGVAAIAAGGTHTCALSLIGAVVCWGYNTYGQLGDGTWTDRLTPTAVSGLASGVVVVAAGEGHTCAVTAVGGVLCWGHNTSAQLGDGTTTNRSTPTAVSGLGSGVVTLAAGSLHTCAVTAAGGVVCWGYNTSGQLGDGTTTRRLTPTAVSGLGSGVTGVAALWDHNCALTAAGGVLCWGSNDYGQLGDGTTTNRSTPTAVSGLGSAAAAVAAGYAHTCALTAAGGVLCWGWNAYGQLGDGTTTNSLTPVRVPGFGTAASSDLTGDGQSDLVWRHAMAGQVWLWPMNGATRVAETHAGTVSDTGFEIRGLGDQNGDGKADLMWRHKTAGLLYYWPMNGGTRLAEAYVATVAPAYDIVGTGDYNGDGKSDILWRHLTNGELWVWLMNGATTVSATYITTIDPGYTVVGSGDLNGDGKADIVWRGAGGDVWVWLMNGATPTATTYVTTIGDLGYQIVGVADHTGDGKADILWHHNTRGEVWLWPMNGTTLVSQSYVGIVPDTGYRIVGSGDYNGDGKADILWHHNTRGEVWVWPMNGATRLSETKVATVPDTGYQIVKVK
jgi:alpha-tubulin suppressor-like RCC1 family protein